MDIVTGEELSSFIGQFVHPVKGEGIGVKGVDGENRYVSQLRASLYQRI